MTDLAAGLIAAPASAQTVYVNIASGTDGVALAGDLVIDDLQLEGGGLLQTVTIALTAANGIGTTFTAVTLSLALDGGDGLPDVTGMGDDSFLFQVFLPAVEVARCLR